VTPGFVGADLKVLAREAGMLAVSRIVGSNPDSDTVESTKYINQLLNGGASDHPIETERVVVEMCCTPDNSNSESDVVISGDASSMGSRSGHGDSNSDSNVAMTDVSKPGTTSSTHHQHLLESVSAETPWEGQGQGPMRAPESINEGALPCISPENIAVGMEDFLSAAKHVQPTAKREGFAVVPDVSWGELMTCSAFSSLFRTNRISATIAAALLYKYLSLPAM
jgi:ribosome biogenesis ATPase